MLNDEKLAALAIEGKLSAFEELVNRYKNSVFGIVYRILGQYQEAEDVTQEVFIIIFEKLYQFDPTRKFSPWINRIAVNTSISHLRKKKKVLLLEFDEAFNQYEIPYSLCYKNDPETMFAEKELEREINEAIEALPESYREIILLRYRLDLNNQEIAEALGISRENVEVKVHRPAKHYVICLYINGMKRGSHMNCRQIDDYLLDYCENKLPAHLCNEIEEHLKTCPLCRNNEKWTRAENRILSKSVEIPPLAPNFDKKLMQILRSREEN
jgi:RNA polymerase sigma-70 factor (ECF subfamily)